LPINRVLVTGGGKHSRGSESVLLDLLNNSVNPIFVDINVVRVPTVIANLTSGWPFREGFFDLIISTWLVEHLESPKQFFCEAFRLLKSGGIVFCVVPFIARKHGSPYDYFRFTDTGLLHLGFSSGFRNMEVRPVGGTPFICCIALLWPLFRLPCVGYFLFLLGMAADSLLQIIIKMIGRGDDLINSYPINYVIVAIK
jgi:SAM-dependent methyltransferase